MKNFLKVFIIIILVIGTIGGTCYFFFRNMEEKDNTTASIAGELYSESKLQFNQSLLTMNALVNSDGTDDRLALLIETNSQVDEIVEVLASYHIENDTKINNEKISKALNQVSASRSLINSMVAEYSIKKDSSYFNRHLGANDFYQEFCNYLVSYAKFANLVNANLSVNKQIDLKFNMFDIYTNVVMNTFNQTITSNLKVIVKDAYNINKINDILQIDNSLIETEVERFAIEINYFNEAYNNCNKTDFATNLVSNIATVTNADQTTNEKIATYYFKQIFGV
ncbi:MAG: hypothetical protein IJ415_02565 [Clostridia bacterium]|nr:hypothetical protein [Clostridia bacterium]